MSALRIGAMVAGVAIWGVVVLRLRRHSNLRIDVWMLGMIGTGLLVLGAFPAVADFPSGLLALNKEPRGRLLALMIFAIVATLLLIARQNSRLNRLQWQYLRLALHSTVKDLAADQLAASAPDVLVIVPAYNESKNLEAVLPRIPTSIAGRKVTTAVIDDGSSDNTADVARAMGHLVVSHPVNLGGGVAILSGFSLARRLGAEFVVTMDGDGQHDPAEMGGLLEPLFQGQADVVIGSRVLGATEMYSPIRYVGVLVFSAAINLLMGTQITDCASGYRALRSGALQQLRLQQEQYHTAELIIEAAKRRLRIVERPVHLTQRISGKSKKGSVPIYAVHFFRVLLSTWWR
jgi:Glycosyl transferase family 2